tara:strand:- start:2256 stop:2702 length:447 start_codon:yes stop_codon:yes gene_type:complete
MRTFLAFLFICFSFSSSAQELLGSAGASGSSNFSLGEFSINTLSDSSNSLTQGFQQTKLSAVSIESTELLSDLILFPNPTNEYFKLQWGVDMESCTLIISDMFGKVIRNSPYKIGENYYVGDLAGGEYFLRAVFNEVDFKSFKVTIVK